MLVSLILRIVLSDSEILIRRCTVEDLHVLRELSLKTFSKAFADQNNPEDFQAYLQSSFSQKKLSQELENPNSEYYFLYHQNDLAGFLKLNFNTAQNEFQDDFGMEIQRIYVTSDKQGLGIGSVLLNKALELAKARKLSYIWLGVWERNPRAQALYQRYGFYKFDKHSFKLGRDLQTDILMKLEISNPERQ